MKQPALCPVSRIVLPFASWVASTVSMISSKASSALRLHAMEDWQNRDSESIVECDPRNRVIHRLVQSCAAQDPLKSTAAAIIQRDGDKSRCFAVSVMSKRRRELELVCDVLAEHREDRAGVAARLDVLERHALHVAGESAHVAPTMFAKR